MLDATTINDDIDGIFSDFNHSITVSGPTYAGYYAQVYVESNGFAGYIPMFVGKANELGALTEDTAVTVTSDLDGITDKAFTIKQIQPAGVLVKLFLHEA